MVRTIKDGNCCACCAIEIANGDTSGCRDFYGHDHPSAYSKITNGHLVITSEESEVIVGPCDLCGSGDGYMEGHTYAILSDRIDDQEAIRIAQDFSSSGMIGWALAALGTRHITPDDLDEVYSSSPELIETWRDVLQDDIERTRREMITGSKTITEARMSEELDALDEWLARR